jgi:deoxycytidylate deaminase
MKSDKRVRFAALVDGNGRILSGGMREGIQPIEPLEKTPELIAKLVSVQKSEDLTEFFGKQEYSILVHEEVVALIFRSKKKFVLVTANRKLPLNKATGLRKLAMAWERD